jgi:hypothetical protein
VSLLHEHVYYVTSDYGFDKRIKIEPLLKPNRFALLLLFYVATSQKIGMSIATP